MSNYRGGGGGYRDRERDNSYRDSFRDRDRDRDWRDRERDRDGRRDPRYDDSRRRYDGHDGLERPLGDAYERSGDRRRPPRDYDRPPPRRFDRDERDYDRPARFGPPPGRFDDVPRGPRSTRRTSRSPSPPSGPRFDREARGPAEYDRHAPLAPRRRSISPSSQSSSSRRPRSPDRRPLSPAPLDREKFRSIPATKSPLESGEERTDSPVTGRTTSSTATSASGSLSIRGSATAPSTLATSTASKPLDARAIAAQRATSKPPSSASTPTEQLSIASERTQPVDAVAPPPPPSGPRDISSRTASPPPPPALSVASAPSAPSVPAIPTGPRALRDGRGPELYQGSHRGGGSWGSRGGRGAYSSGYSGQGTYASRPSQRDHRDQPAAGPSSTSVYRAQEEETKSWSNDAGPWPAPRALSPGPSKDSWQAETPQKETTSGDTVWGQGQASTSRWPSDARSSPQDIKHGGVPGSSPAVQTKEQEAAWGGASPFVNKEKATGWKDEAASVEITRRDSRGASGWNTTETNPSSPSSWGHQTPYAGSESRRGAPYRGRGGFSGRGSAPRDSGRRYGGPGGPAPSQQDKDAEDAEKKLAEREPWRAHLAEAEMLRKKREEDLDKALLICSTATRKALRDLELLEGELTAVNLNRKLRKEHLDTFKETFLGGAYGSGDVAMI